MKLSTFLGLIFVFSLIWEESWGKSYSGVDPNNDGPKKHILNNSICTNGLFAFTVDFDQPLICIGGGSTASVSSGPGGPYTYQWQYLDGGTWVNVMDGTPTGAVYTSATSASMNVSGISANGSYTYRCEVTESGSSPENSSPAILDVVSDPTVTPATFSESTICKGGSSDVSVTASSGTGTFTYQWEYSLNGTNWSSVTNGSPTGAIYTNATTATLTASGITATGSYQYRCNVTQNGSGCALLPSEAGTLAVVSDPEVTSATLSNSTICQGGSSDVSVMAMNGTGTFSYQWEYSPNGTTWNNVTNGTPTGAIYMNATTDKLTASGISVAGSYRYRCNVTQNGSGCNLVPSGVVILTVVSDPKDLAVQATKTQICKDGTTILSVTSNGGTGTPLYEWQKSADNINWLGIANSNANSYQPSSATPGNTFYRAKLSYNGEGCDDAFSQNNPNIKVWQPPLAQFGIDYNNYFPKVNGFINCLNQSTQGDIAISNWNWNFVSPNKDTPKNNVTNENQSFIPTEPGDLNICLKLVDNNLCKDTFCAQTINITNGDCVVKNVFITDLQKYCAGQEASLTADFDKAGGLEVYQWTWDPDGAQIISGGTNENIKLKFVEAKTYNIKVSFVQYPGPGIDNCYSNTFTKQIEINPNPDINFEVDKNEVCSGQKVKLRFGLDSADPYTLIGQNINILNKFPNAPNNYIEIDYPSDPAGLTTTTDFVLLSATNNTTQCSTTFTNTKQKVIVNPNPKLTVDPSCTAQNDGYTVAYSISSGSEPFTLNGDTVSNSGITDTFNLITKYSLNVVDFKGCVDSISGNPPNCVCQFTNSTLKENIFNVCLGDNFNFEAIKNDASPPAGYAVQYVLLDFLGNTISLVPVIFKGTDFFKTPNFPFSSLSNVKVDSLYRVRAITGLYTNDKFDPDDTCLDTILGPKVYFRSLPKALFAFDPDTVCAGKPVKGHLKFQDYPNNSKEIEFKENDTPPGTSITWNTRDTMFDRNYFVKGIQEFKVIKITDKVYNCISNDTLRFFLKVDSLPNSAISSMPVCEGQTLEIKTNVKPSYTYEWKKDNTIFSSNNQLNLPSSGIKDYGTYALTITDGNGCSNSNSIIIDNKKIQTTPTPSITTEVAPCDNAYDVIYTANGSPTDSAFVWTVSGGDSLYQILDSVSVHWKKGGAPREITVVVTSTAGCTSNPVTIPVQTKTEEAPDVAEILWAPGLHLLICQEAGLCYQWGTSTYGSDNRITKSDTLPGETAQAYYLPKKDDDPFKIKNTWYWVDIWSSPCTQPGSCKTRCYFKRTFPKGSHFGPLPDDELNGSDSTSNKQQKLRVNMYPNPTNDLLNLDIDCTVNTSVVGQFYLPDGRMVLESSWDCKAGDNKLQIPLGQLQAGLYFLVLKESESAEMVRKPLVIQR